MTNNHTDQLNNGFNREKQIHFLKIESENFGIHVCKEYFNFSAAHFLIFPDHTCERLHGHNYQVEAKIEGSLAQSGLIYDFQDIKPIIKSICNELDHCILIPGKNPSITISPGMDLSQNQDSLYISYKEKKYMFPAAEVIILPIDNTSVERLAFHITEKLLNALSEKFDMSHLKEIKVKVYETAGQYGYFIKKFI
jgi:6-pyruvoyltetrahydropterin/6-carboxytetrahydropterin synthase